MRLAVADPLRRQVAVDLPLRSAVGQAVAARSARLADAAHEPLLCYEARVVDGAVCLLVLLPVLLHLPGKVLDHLPLVLLALVVLVEEDLFEVRRPGYGGVEPLPGDVRELVVEDGDGFLYGAALEGVAGPAVVVDEVLLDQADGERHGVAQRYHVPLDRRDGVFVIHVEDLLLDLEPRSAHERLPLLVRLALLEQRRSDRLADRMAGGVPVR